MKFVVFFLLQALAQGACVALLAHPARHLLLWPALSCVVLAYAYARNRPHLVSGKSNGGRVSWFWTTLNLPWLLFTWTTWIVLAVFSREPRVSRLEGTNIYLGRWPLLGPALSKFDVVVDLAAELPRWYHFPHRYEALPNLDGMPLVHDTPSVEIGPETVVLVHCAQGHGRTASFVVLLLCRMGITSTVEDALALIHAHRPLARLSRSQRRAVTASVSLASPVSGCARTGRRA